MENKLYLDAGKQSFEKQDLRCAQSNFEMAVQNSQTGGDKLSLAVALNWLGKSLFKENKLLAAEAAWQRSVDTLGSRQNKDTNILNQVLCSLADTKFRLGKFSEAEKLYQDLIKDDCVIKRNPEVCAAAASGLVRIYQQMGRPKDASLALEQRKKLTRKDDSEFDAFNAIDIGTLLVDLGNSAAAQPLFESVANNSAANLSDRADATLSLARIACDEGKLEDADKRIKLILDEFKKAPDSHILQMGAALSLQSSINLAAEKNRQALDAAQQAVASVEKVLGAKSALLIDCLRQRGEAYAAIDDYRAAERDYRKLLNLEKDNYGDSSVSLSRDYSALGYLLIQQGKYQSAEELYKQALALTTRTFGSDSAATATALNNLALVYINNGDHARAEQLVREALEMRKKIFSERSCATARSMTNLATIFIEQNKRDAAEQILRRAIEIQEELLTPCHPELIGTQRILVELYLAEEKFSEAEPLLRRIMSNDEDNFGADSAAVAVDLEKLAKLLSALKRDDEYTETSKKLESLKNRLREDSGLALENSSTSGAPESDREVVLPGQVQPVKDKWALIIGITNFKDPSINLKYAAKDATDFRNFLIQDANFKADHVKLLTDENATREKIVANLGESWLRRLANPDDLVIIYVSSHGSPERKDIGGANFIVPYEGTLDNLILTGIPMQWLTTGIQETVHCNRILLILDICHAGAAGNSSKGFLRTINDQVLGPGQLVIASSKADQISWESAQYPNGVFTRRLIEGFRATQARGGLSKAFEHMRSKVEEEVLRDRAKLQTPVVYSRQWRGGDVTIYAMPHEPRPGLHEEDTSHQRSVPPAAGVSPGSSKPAGTPAKRP